MNYELAIVTGAARGIGEVVAAQLAAAGGRVVLSDINAEGVEAAAARIREAGGDAVGMACDVGSDEDVTHFRDAVVERLGAPDLLINNAAAQQFGSGGVDELDLSRWRASFEVNVLGDVRMVHAFLPAMRAAGRGHIVNTASSLAIRPNAVVQHLMPYVTSKGAVMTFTYALAFALKDTPLDVSLFCPGLTSTTPDGSAKPKAMGWMKDVPEELTRPGTMTDAAAALLDGLASGQFLISSDAGYAAAIVRFAQAGLDPLSDFNKAP